MSDSTSPRLPACLSSKAGWSALFEARRSAQPHVHQIEPTNRCPYQCVMCPRHSKMVRPQGLMEMALYRRLIDEIGGFSPAVRAKEIELFHFGESLLHPQLPEMVRLGAEKSLKMTLSVNPPHLTAKASAELLTAGAFKIIVSLDGNEAATYRKIRGPAAKYDKGVANVRHLIAIHREMRSPTQLVLRTIQMHENDPEIEAMRRRWEDEGIAFEARAFFPWSEGELAALGNYDRYPPHMPCPFPWQYLVVQWDGRVVPCCRDYNAANVVGDARTQSLVEIWNGPVFEAFRRQHETGDFAGNVFCRDCSAIYCT